MPLEQRIAGNDSMHADLADDPVTVNLLEIEKLGLKSTETENGAKNSSDEIVANLHASKCLKLTESRWSYSWGN